MANSHQAFTYIIEELQLDPTENSIERAMYYKPAGIMLNLAAARQYAESASYEVGTGWPIKKGVKQARRRVITVPVIVPYGEPKE